MDAEKLTPKERERLTELENVIQRGLQTFAEVGDALTEIYDRRLDRGHLTQTQRRDRIAAALKAHPERSNRQIADALNVHHTTVGAQRAKLEASGDVPQMEATVGADGKTRSTKRAGVE